MTPLIAHINPIGISLPEAISKAIPDTGNKSDSQTVSNSDLEADSKSHPGLVCQVPWPVERPFLRDLRVGFRLVSSLAFRLIFRLNFRLIFGIFGLIFGLIIRVIFGLSSRLIFWLICRHRRFSSSRRPHLLRRPHLSAGVANP